MNKLDFFNELEDIIDNFDEHNKKIEYLKFLDNKYIFKKLRDIYGDDYRNKIDIKGDVNILLRVHKYTYNDWYMKYYCNDFITKTN